MDGLHIIANLKNCQFDFLNEQNLLSICHELCTEAGLHVVGQSSYIFEPQGFTFTLLLAESHLCIHTWPEYKSIALDIYTCNHSENNNSKTQLIYKRLITILKPEHQDVKFLNREDLSLINKI
jgi:S-adenosylmethionine decarboxylase